MPSKTNNFATKADLKRLERKMDQRFERVDQRFEQIDQRFKQVDQRFEQVDQRFEQVDGKFTWLRTEIKNDFQWWKKDTYREFEHRWQQLADPILKEVMAMREEQKIHYQQHDAINQQLKQINQRFEQVDQRFEQTQRILQKIAKKVGVK